MKVQALFISLCLYFCCVPFVAHAQKLCMDSATDWQCFGQIDFRMNIAKGAESKKTLITRMIFFKNDEELIQIEADGSQMQYFILPSKVTLYSGIPKTKAEKDEIKQFLAVSQIYLSLPLELLINAYPAGPESVPEGTSTKTFKLYGGEPSQTITTTRSGSNHITFLTEDNKSSNSVGLSGSWDSQLAEPYPDDFSLSGWDHAGKDVLKNLLDARSSAISNAKQKQTPNPYKAPVRQ